MTLTQILQKIRNAFYTKKEIDSMGGGASLSDTISQKANDSDVVHKIGQETIDGNKVFLSAIFVRDIVGKPNDDGGSHVYIGAGPGWDTHAALILNGAVDGWNGTGSFTLIARYPGMASYLIGTPNGSLTWNNKNIVRSVNGITADADGNIDLLPIGSYIQFAGTQAPSGFLVCNGGEISRTTYAKLFAVIGTTYGSGDGSTTFNLPNLTDRFLQGSASVGTVKDAGLPNITGTADGCVDLYMVKSTKNGVFSGSVYDKEIHVEDNAAFNDDWGYTLDFNASNSNPIYGNSNTVQPPALTCLICIKY